MTSNIRVSLRKVRLNQGGYTDRGEYFGIGPAPLWYAEWDYNYPASDSLRPLERGWYLRAHDRADAIEFLLKDFPSLTRNMIRR